ncbi:glycosyltransferase [Salinisphaera sp.]|uniref:glycosyltransferase n=1 Tax=Salinisphaera sp. TaxID=1914330 RepID=UPI003C7B2AB5
MACGYPVVATNCPTGLSEVLEGGRYGPLVPVGDVKPLAKAMMNTFVECRCGTRYASSCREAALGADSYETAPSTKLSRC